MVFKGRWLGLNLCEDVGGDCREEVIDVDVMFDLVDIFIEVNCGRWCYFFWNVYVRSGVGKGLEKVKIGGIFIIFLFKVMWVCFNCFLKEVIFVVDICIGRDFI